MSLNRWNKHSILSFIDSHIINYPTPINLNYMWSFGSAAGLCLVIQIITGIFLAMHYTPQIDLAFNSDGLDDLNKNIVTLNNNKKQHKKIGCYHM